MNDFISRQAAIDAVADLYWMDERLLNFKKEIDVTFGKIKALPSADPVKRGKWIKIEGMSSDYYCSECEQKWWTPFPEEMHYCPNCGARMDGVEKIGHWVDHIKDFWCSECGGRIQKEQAKMFLTCPYCGARMDGEE